MEENNFDIKKTKKLKKISKQRLKNIALHYLKRFDSSVANLRFVLLRRINDYAYYNPDFDKRLANEWIEEIISDFEKFGYLDDKRYCEIKIRNYVAAGKSYRYIQGKLKQKGVDLSLLDEYFSDTDYNPFDAALALAKKKKIGPFRIEEKRQEMRNKDLSALVRAGFDYDVACKVLNFIPEEEVY